MKIQLFAFLLLTTTSCRLSDDYIANEGIVFGTTYHIVYQYKEDLQPQLMEQIAKVDKSLSTYNPQSVISKVNTNDSSVVLDDHFLTVFNKSLEISQKTDSAFDITVAPLVNAWGFGFKKKETITPAKIDSILAFVGIGKVALKHGKIVKSDPRLMLDASAIAKGYGVDVAALFLESQGINNYMVEIGGELRVKGVNAKDNRWSVGIDKPIDDPTVSNRELEAVLKLSNQSLATSGNYRNFYVEGNKKYAHTINPKTGYPVQTEVLSVSIIAPDCMTADAYATAFMVLGLEKAMAIANREPNIEAYFIYNDENGVMKTAWTTGFDGLLERE